MKTCDLVIIGGGPAGLAAALGARKQGIKDILIVERDKELGGILNSVFTMVSDFTHLKKS